MSGSQCQDGTAPTRADSSTGEPILDESYQPKDLHIANASPHFHVQEKIKSLKEKGQQQQAWLISWSVVCRSNRCSLPHCLSFFPWCVDVGYWIVVSRSHVQQEVFKAQLAAAQSENDEELEVWFRE